MRKTKQLSLDDFSIITRTKRVERSDAPTTYLSPSTMTQTHAQQKHVETHKLIVFTDGACINNGRPNAKAAYACVWPDYPQYNVGLPMSPREAQTNNRAEYRAFLHALIQADDVIDPSRTRELHVYTDSQLMIDSFTKWIYGWKRKGWKKSDGSPVANVDLLCMIDEKMKFRKVMFKHVRAHTNKKDWESVHNDMVDRLARSSVA